MEVWKVELVNRTAHDVYLPSDLESAIRSVLKNDYIIDRSGNVIFTIHIVHLRRSGSA